MPSPLLAILKDELTSQRVFLSAEEEQALTKPVAYDDEDDLAYARVQGRLSWLQPMLRNRFIKDGRPIAQWREYVAQDEQEAGEPTLISHLGSRVIAWATRTSDRGAMLGGFASTALLGLGLLFMMLGAYAWFHGAQLGGAIFVVVGLLFFFAGRTIGRLARRRAERLAEQALHGEADQGQGTGTPPRVPSASGPSVNGTF